MRFKKITLPVVLLAFATASCFGQTEQTRPVKIFILGGQSNMDGCGKAEELPEAYTVHPENTITWDDQQKKWVPLGTGTTSEKRNFKFGPEIAFSHVMAKQFPGSTIAIVKTSAGGTKLWQHWMPGQGMHKRFIGKMKNALQQLTDSGRDYEICGMLWMQGESDAEDIEKAKAYEENLKTFFKAVRIQTHKADLPIVMGRISSSLLKETPWNFDHAKIVQQAQENVANADDHIFIINTDHLETLKDNTHFNTKAQLWLGAEMGKTMLKEINHEQN